MNRLKSASSETGSDRSTLITAGANNTQTVQEIVDLFSLSDQLRSIPPGAVEVDVITTRTIQKNTKGRITPSRSRHLSLDKACIPVNIIHGATKG
jgi:hypothetical protein